jgi:hypothetical protein
MTRTKLSFLALTLSLASLAPLASAAEPAADWKADPIWHDGLVEKATYAATRVIYGKPRAYEAVFFTNKEQHDVQTWTKSDKSQETVEVFKHNQIEVVPTPNYDYKFAATSHLTVDGLKLTRVDVSSQEYCGTSFKQYQLRQTPRAGAQYQYFGFSYMPEAGRVEKTVASPDARTPLVAYNSLPVWLRDFDFAKREPIAFALLPDQKSNRATSPDPVPAEAKYAGEESGSHKIEVYAKGQLLGTYWFAVDRQYVMTKYQSADGQQTYELKGTERTNYWTIREE